MADQSNADDLQEAAGSIEGNLPPRYIGDVVADLNRRINVEQAAGNENLTSERTQELSTAHSILAPYATTGRLSDEAIERAHQIVTRLPPPPITRAKPDARPAPDTRSTAQVLTDAREYNAKQKVAEKQENAKPAPLESPEIQPPDRETTDALKAPEAAPSSKPADVAATPPGFAPTTDWQDIPDGAILPPGLQIQMNVATGRNQARYPPPQKPPAPAQQPASAATPRQPAPVSPAAQPATAPATRPPQQVAASPAQPRSPPATPAAVVPSTPRETARPEPDPAPQTQTGYGQGNQPPPPATPAAAPADDDEPNPTWRQNFDRRRSEGQGRVRAAAGAAKDSTEDYLIDQQIRREDAARDNPRVQSADREAQRAGGTTAPPHPLVEAAGRALASDQDLANQNRQQFMAAQASDEGLPPTLQSPEAYYAASKLGYRPGDPRAPSPAGRRDRSDDPGLQWRDLGDVDEESRDRTAERLQRTREAMQAGVEIPPDREALAQALRHNENLTAADAYVIQQRQEHGTDPQVVSPPRKASFAERMLGIKDDDEDKDGLRTAKMVGAVEYGEHAIRQYAAAGSEGARPFIGDAPAAIAGSAGQAMAGMVGGAGTVAAGAATGNPLLIAKGMADLGAEVVKLPGMLVDWSDALISSADNIKQFSSVLANAFAVAELRTMQRDFGSAQRTGDASANLIDARQDLADTLQPIKDSATNALSKDIANGLRDLNDIVSMFRELLQWAGVMKSDEELKEELQRKGTPFQETIAGIKAGGFAAQNPDGQWAVANLEGQFGGQGMGGDPTGGQRPEHGIGSGAGRAGLPPWRRTPGGDEPERDGAAPAAPRGVGRDVAEARRAQDRQRIRDKYERERAELAKIDKPTPKQNAAAKTMDDAFAAQEAKWREQDEARKAKEIEAFRRAGQGISPRASGKPGRTPGSPELPDEHPESPFPGVPGPFRDRRDQKLPKVHAAPEEPARGHSAVTGGMLGMVNLPAASLYHFYSAIRAAMGGTQEDTRPPSQTAGNVP